MRPRTLLILLLVAVAVPIAWVEYSFTPRPPTETSTPHGARWPVDPKPADPPPEPAVPSLPDPANVPEAPDPDPQDPVGPILEFHGTLRSSGRQEMAGVEVAVHDVHGVRPVWTNTVGEFAFSVAPQNLPIRLANSGGQTLYRLERPRVRRTLVNPSLTPPSVSGDGFALFEARAVVFERGVGTEDCRVRVFGSTRLPPSTNVVVRLLAGGDRIVQETIFPYGGDDLIGEIEFPFDDLYSGWYKLQIAWRVFSAPSEVLDQFRARLPEPLPGEVPEKMHLAVYLGDPDSERIQEAEIQAFYEAAIRECRVSRDLVQWVASSARGEPRKLSAGRAEAVRRHSLFSSVRSLASKSPSLKKWREFIDRDLPGLWQPYRVPGAIPFPAKYPDRKQYLLLAFDQLSKLSRLESRLLYRAIGVAPDPRDHVDFDFGVETEHQLTEQRLREFLDALVKNMREA